MAYGLILSKSAVGGTPGRTNELSGTYRIAASYATKIYPGDPDTR